MKRKSIMILILTISLLFCTVKAANIMQLQDAYQAKIIITRYIQASENEEIKNTYPTWINITEKQQEELDYNVDGNIDSEDLLIITRHILALEDENIRKTYPTWIIDLDTIANKRANAIDQVKSAQQVTTSSTNNANNNTSVKTTNQSKNTTKINVEKIKLNNTSLTLEETQQSTLIAEITPTMATNKKLKWESSNPTIVEVNQKGTITAKSTGTAQIIVSSEDDPQIKEICNITVKNKTIEAKEILISNVTIIKGQSNRIARIWKPVNTTDKIKWTSSNENIVKVDNNGNIKGLKVGKARIQAKLNDKVYATSTVTVIADKVQQIQAKSKKITLTMTKSKFENEELENLVNFIPSEANNKKMKWKIENTNIATIKDGKVQAVELGETVLIGQLASNPKLQVKINVSVEHTEDAKKKIENATSWMENIANDNSHGYNLSSNERFGQHGDYSCSGLNIMGWENGANIPLRKEGGAYTSYGSGIKIYEKYGFREVTNLVNISTKEGLERGDVLLYSGHTAQYCGDNKMAEACGDADGKRGDSTRRGNEISINRCRNGILKVMRYYGI